MSLRHSIPLPSCLPGFLPAALGVAEGQWQTQQQFPPPPCVPVSSPWAGPGGYASASVSQYPPYD